MKQQIQIEVDIPEGYEATGEFRQPREGEYFIDTCGDAVSKGDGVGLSSKRIILRKKWQWPEWLTATYIAMDEDGDWWAYAEEPFKRSSRWYGDAWSWLSPDLYQIEFPAVSDWTQSLIKNPNKE